MSASLKKSICFGLLILSGLYLAKILLGSFTNLGVSDFSTYYHIPQFAFQSHGKHPYTNHAPFHPYYYPPPSLLLFWPLTQLDFFVAKVFFSVLALFAFIGSFVLAIKISEKKLTDLELSTLFFLLAFFYPLRFTLVDGQINTILLFLITGAFYAYRKSRDYLAGLLLALAAIFKISPFLLIFYFMVKRRYKIIVSAVITFITISLLVEVFVDTGINWFYWRHIVDDVSKQGGPSYRDQSLNSFLLRIGLLKSFWNHYLSATFEGTLLTFKRFISLINYSIVGFFSLVIFWKGRAVKERGDIRILFEYLLLLILAVVGSGLAWFHQYTIFIFPLIIAFIFAFKISTSLKRIISLSILLISYLAMAISLENQFHISDSLRGFKSAVMFYGLFLLWLVLLYFRYGRSFKGGEV